MLQFESIGDSWNDMRKARVGENRDFYLAVGRRIAELREGKMTQESLAIELRLTRTSVINIEKGRQQIFLHTLVNIARALKVLPSDLLPVETNIDDLLRGSSKKGQEWVKTLVSDVK